MCVACGFLKSTYAQITTAGGGPEGLDILEREKFDLVLLDSFMPVSPQFLSIKARRKDRERLGTQGGHIRERTRHRRCVQELHESV